MAKYIELEAAVKAFNNFDAGRTDSPPCTLLTPEEFAEYLYEIPTADVAPVVYGRWIRPHWKNNNYCCDCSECGGEAMHRDYQWDKNGVYPICPNCGAKMDGGADHEAG